MNNTKNDEISRRVFCQSAIALGTVAALAPRALLAKTIPHTNQGDTSMSITLPDLPYAKDALAPHISEETMNFHYGKHHQAYVTNLNGLIENTEFAGKSLEDIISMTGKNTEKQGIFNNAAQVWNHTFYWNSMKPAGGGKPSGKIAEKIESDLGGYDAFRKKFTEAAKTQFGSGWAWLVLDNGKLKIEKTPNAYTPILDDKTAILTIDVWEHAYYLDYQNKRPDYIETFLDHLINWDFAEKNLLAA